MHCALLIIGYFFCLTTIAYGGEKPNTLDVGFAFNQGSRPFMEDAVLCITNDRYPLIGVLDGHGGDYVVNAVKKKLEDYKSTHPNLAPSEENIKKLCFDTHVELKAPDGRYRGGSTASLLFMRDNNILCTQVGDSAIINSAGELVIEPHSPKNPREIERVGAHNITSGSDPRLKGKLSMTRSFGNHYLEKYNLTAEPEIKTITLNDNDFLVVATDGVYDEFFNAKENITHAAHYIAAYVKQRISDNISLNRIAEEVLFLSAYQKDRRDKCMKNLKNITDDAEIHWRFMQEENELKELFDNQSIIIVHKKVPTIQSATIQ